MRPANRTLVNKSGGATKGGYHTATASSTRKQVQMISMANQQQTVDRGGMSNTYENAVKSSPVRSYGPTASAKDTIGQKSKLMQPTSIG